MKSKINDLNAGDRRKLIFDQQNSIGSFKAISLMQNAINVPSFKRHLIDAQKHKLYQIELNV